MEDFLKAFEESVGEGVEGIAVALVLMAMGVVISLLGAVLGENSAIYYWLIFLVIISLADIVVIFETAEEALKSFCWLYSWESHRVVVSDLAWQACMGFSHNIHS